MHMHHRSSSSSSPLRTLCSVPTIIGLAVILCVFFTFQSSISLHETSLPTQHIKTASFPSTVYSTPIVEVEPLSSHHHPDPYAYTQKQELLSSAPVISDEEENLGGLAEDFYISWGDGRGKFLENGDLLTLSLDKSSGSGFESKKEYLFAKIDIQIKLIPDNSAGTVTTFYMSSNGTKHDEIDFEFLGNVSGQPYTLHTNIYSQGKGNREQQFYLWFDPTEDFHTYSILWTPQRIVFYVDGVAIREFKNMEDIGVPFPNKQPMKILSSLWNADDWATQGGRVHADWSKAPFVASFRNFSANACVWSSGSSSCGSDPRPSGSKNAWLKEELDSDTLKKMRWVQENYMTYNYCSDKWRFQEGLPKECTLTKSKPNKGRKYR